jgi:hypothetical protein
MSGHSGLDDNFLPALSAEFGSILILFYQQWGLTLLVMEWLKKSKLVTGNISYSVYSSNSLNFLYVLFALLQEQVKNMKPNG